MYPASLDAFDEIVHCDTEYHLVAGNLPQDICIVLYEQRARRVTRLWLWGRRSPPPAMVTSRRILFVAYTATAELVLFQVLGWPLPPYVLDLNVEMRNCTNGERPETFISLHRTAQLLRVPYIDLEHKTRMRDIAIAGGPLVDAHRQEMLRYCEDDTRVLAPILARLLPQISLPHALIRGDYVKASAAIEYRGLPVNTAAYQHILAFRQPIRVKEVSFAIGDDGRNRYLGGLFGTITSRNNPKASQALLHRARWWRNLLRPGPGRALAYLDFSSEEFMVQAVLAEDRHAIADYQSGDVYVAWGRTVGLIPPNGTNARTPESVPC